MPCDVVTFHGKLVNEGRGDRCRAGRPWGLVGDFRKPSGNECEGGEGGAERSDG